MRNLKKVLSLALALVMLLGMMVVGAGAAEFKDADSIENTEAVDVVSGIGVLQGDENKNFNPTGTLSRAEAAVVIAKLDLGAAFGNLETTNASTFSDVPAGYWGKAYIDYCAARGLIAGDGAGRFLPNEKVSGVQFALMVARVLGYEDKAEQIGGADWEVEAAALARKAGLTDGVTLGSLPMTRDDMAQVTYNALKANMVEYKNGTIDITVGGTPVTIGGNPATAKAATGAHYDKSAKQDGILQLCEEKFPQLTVESSEDNFYRPSNVWTYKRTDIAEVPTAAHAEYTKGTKGTTINSALKPDSDATVEYYVDGKQDTTIKTVANLKDKTSIGDKGVLTQAWYDEVKNIVKVTLINTYVGRVSGVTKATATADRYITVSAFVSPANVLTGLNTKFETEDFASRDVVLYTAAWDGTEYDIQTVEALGTPDTGRLTAWKGTTYGAQTGNSNSNFTSNGTTYEYSANKVIVNDAGAQTGASGIAAFKVNETDINVYTDKYGYAIYVSGVEGEKNYAAVIGVGTQNIYGSGADGCTLLLPDGTIKTVTYRMKSGSASLTSSNVVNNNPSGTNKEGYSADIVYYRELDNGTYELEVVNGTTAKHEAGFNAADDIKFVNGKSAFVLSGHTTPALNKTLYTTSNTIFMVATKDGSSGRIAYNVYTGYNNAPSIDETKVNQSVAYVTNSYYTSQIDVVYLAYESMAGITSVDAFIAKGKDATILTDSTGSYYELAAVVDGEVTTLKVDASITSPVNLKNNANTEGVWPITNVVRDRNDIITSFSVANVFTSGVNGVAGTVSANGVVLGVGDDATPDADTDTLIANATYWAYTDNTKVYAVSKDYKTIETIDIAGVDTDLNDKVFASVTDGAAGSEKKLKDVFVVTVDNTTATTPTTPTTPAGTYDIDISTPGAVEVLVDKDATAAQKAEIAVLNQIIAAIKAEGWTVADGAATKSGNDWTIKASQGAIAQDFVWATDTDFVTTAITVTVGTTSKLMKADDTIADLGDGEYAKVSGSTGANNGFKGKTTTLVDGATYDIGYYEVAAADSNNNWNLKSISGTGVVDDTGAGKSGKYYAKSGTAVTIVMDQDSAADLATTATVTVSGDAPTTKAVTKAGVTAVAATATIDVADADKTNATVGSHTGLDLTGAGATGTDSTNHYSWSAVAKSPANSGYTVTVTRTGDNATKNEAVDGITFANGVDPVKAEITFTLTTTADDFAITAVAAS